MPEHLDARTTKSRDMFYCILASKLPLQNIKKNNKNLPTIKFLKKGRKPLFFLLGLKTLIFSSIEQLQETRC